jgi:hypothetical protein
MKISKQRREASMYITLQSVKDNLYSVDIIKAPQWIKDLFKVKHQGLTWKEIEDKIIKY